MTVVEAFMENVKDSVTAGYDVFLRGFGSFIVKQRAEKVARNISKNTTIVIPAHSVPAFKPAKAFLKAVKRENKKGQAGNRRAGLHGHAITNTAAI